MPPISGNKGKVRQRLYPEYDKGKQEIQVDIAEAGELPIVWEVIDKGVN